MLNLKYFKLWSTLEFKDKLSKLRPRIYIGKVELKPTVELKYELM